VAHNERWLRIDVSRQIDDPCRWVLHEMHTGADAHAAERRSPHFLAFDDVGGRGPDGRGIGAVPSPAADVRRRVPLQRLCGSARRNR
jgi:hypothetical protein